MDIEKALADLRTELSQINQAIAVLEALASGRPVRPKGPGKLTPETVKEIRESNETLAVLAARYGVDQSTISLVKRRKRRADVE